MTDTTNKKTSKPANQDTTNTNTSKSANQPSMGPIKFIKTTFGAVANTGVTALEGATLSCNVFKSWIRRCEAEQSAMYERRLKADILSAEDELATEVAELIERRSQVLETLTQLDNIKL